VTEIAPRTAEVQHPSLAVLASAFAAKPLELAVVIPTFNERANVAIIIARLADVLAGIAYEVIVVDDDSPDGTWEEVREIGARQRNVRVLRRIGRRGLASACLEGMMATAAPYIAVMDGDLQHDETVLPQMLARAREHNVELVVASRTAEGGSMGDFSPKRVWLSSLGRKLSAFILHTDISDPMSGFFLVDRRLVDEAVYRTSGVGFKILVDLLASVERPVRCAEVPYTFRLREAGESKLDAAVGLEYIYLLLDKLVGSVIPLRFAMYGLVGAAGAVLHLAVLGLLYAGRGLSFTTSQVAATVIAMTFNFLLNNFFTYRDARLRGRRLIAGLVTFYAACSIGSAVNLSVARDLLERGVPWLLSGLAGLAISSVWNYGVTSVTTWRRRRVRR
jgi:dolichol-phosphate mannosyltransferase